MCQTLLQRSVRHYVRTVDEPYKDLTLWYDTSHGQEARVYEMTLVIHSQLQSQNCQFKNDTFKTKVECCECFSYHMLVRSGN